MKKTITATEETGLLALLCKEIAGVPRSRLRIQIKRREVRVNGVRVEKDVRVFRGDCVELFLPDKFSPPHIGIVYSDEHVVAVDKPSLVESEKQLPELLFAEYGLRLLPAHRLDTRTTGLMLLCRTQAALKSLIEAFKGGQVKKTYYARVFGTLPQRKDTLHAYLTKDAETGYCRVSDVHEKGSVPIVTEYEVVRFDAGMTLVKLSPVTGKTHQLRAHMRHIGCPIVGDDKYGDEAKNNAVGVHGQNLRAVEIAFGTLAPPLGHLSASTISLSHDNLFAPQKKQFRFY